MREHEICLSEGEISLYMENEMVMDESITCYNCHYCYDNDDYKKELEWRETHD